MKCALIVIALSVGLNTQSSHAQLDKKPAEQEVDSAHDKAENDPSRGTGYVLKKLIKQNSLFIHSVSARLDKSVSKSFHSLLSTSTPTEEKSVLLNSAYTDFFKLHAHRYRPQLQFGPTTVNSDHEYKKISDRSHGYCWGYSTLVRYFTTLAFFDPKLPRSNDLEYYQAKIDQVMSGEATLIPGYANLREFSLNPHVEFYLKLAAMEAWRSRAVRVKSFGIFKKAAKDMEDKNVDQLLVDLENRIARGELPKILFSSLVPSETILGMNTDIHVVIAYKVERLPTGGAKIHLWDINFYTETLAREPKFIEVTPKKELKYAPWYEPTKKYADKSDLVARISIAPENDAENVQMLKSLKKFCATPETAEYCISGAAP